MKNNDHSNFSIIKKTFEGHYRLFSLTLFFIFINALLEMVGLGLIMPIIQSMISPEKTAVIKDYINQYAPFLNRYNVVLTLTSLFVALEMVKAGLTFSGAFLKARLLSSIKTQWLKNMYQYFVHSDYKDISVIPQGKLINVASVEVHTSVNSLNFLMDFFSQMGLIAVTYIFLLTVNPQMTLIFTLVFSLVTLVSNVALKNTLNKLGHERVRISTSITTLVSESLNSLKIIKTMNLEEPQTARLKKILKSDQAVYTKSLMFEEIPRNVGRILIAVLFLVLIYYILSQGQSRLKEFIPILGMFVLVAVRLSPAAVAMSKSRMKVLSNLASLENVLKYSTAFQSIKKNRHQGKKLEIITDDLRFENISYSYDTGKNIFKNFDLIVKRNKITAIIGQSGRGKSTLIDLLLGIWSYQSGAIKINGINLKDIELSSWRNLVGYVPQEPLLFNETIKNNLLVANPKASDELIWQTLIMAHCFDFVDALPMKLETNVGDRGAHLSGGQRQRLTVARALIRNPQVLILDEPTSALDQASEAYIQKMIHELKGKMTIIMIAHRQETLSIVDEIVDLGSL